MPVRANRRQFVRLSTDVDVLVSLEGGCTQFGSAVDLSVGGVRFRVAGMQLVGGESLSMRITLKTQTWVLAAEVVRVRDLDRFAQEVAVEFADVDESVLAELLQNLPEAYEPHELIEVGDP